ncbi:MAG: WbqC family protein [Halieaceae bacterium]|nr:WbqC family protein [Halieaceae bacterium]
MKLAIMQPYFFPYIGYWQLINTVDVFILIDDVQFIRHGWVNRNRVLKHGGGWQYITVPLVKHSMNEKIKNIYAHSVADWKLQILRQLEHYNYAKRNKAPFYNEVFELLIGIFSKISLDDKVTTINALIIKEICSYLDISTSILTSSEQQFNYESVEDPGDWALKIAEQMNVDEYMNPIAGKDIFNPEKFQSSNIRLSFLRSDDINYNQGGVFEPWLSIIDVLMFNGKTGTKDFLSSYS